MIGTTVGSYRIVARLGEGAMGAVYRAIDVMLDREVAVKALRPDLSRQAALVERFRSEAVALARLNHPNIAIVHGLVQHEGQLYMVMEYVQGETLEGLLERAGRLDWQRAVEYCAGAADGLQHAHEHGVVHRDIKPSNLMLTRRGVVKVMDFGVARLVDRNRQTRTGMAVGTRMYMSPEQLKGHDVDGRCDVYAMGAVLFELVTGRMPFDADSEYGLLMAQLNEPPLAPSSVLPGLPGAIDGIVARAMAKRPEDRYGSAMDLRRALLAVTQVTVGPAPGPAQAAARAPTAASPTAVAMGPTPASGADAPVRAAATPARTAEPVVPAAPADAVGPVPRVAAAGAVPGASAGPAGPVEGRTAAPTRRAEGTAPIPVADAAAPTRLAEAEATQPAPATRLGQAIEAAAEMPATRIGAVDGSARVAAPPTRVAEAGVAAPPTRVGTGAPATRARPWTVSRLVRDWRAYAAATAMVVAVSAIGLALRYTIGSRRAAAAPDTSAVAVTSPDVMPAAQPAGPAPAQVSSGGPGFRLPEIAGPAESAPAPQPIAKAPARKASPAPAGDEAPPVLRAQLPTTAPAHPAAPEPSAAPAEPAAATPSALAPDQVARALAPFAEAVRANGAATVRRLYAAGGEEDARLLQQVLDLMKEGSLEIEPETPAGVPEAVAGRARVELNATARWRTAFGGNRRRVIRLAAELERAGPGWQLVSVRILGPGLK